MRWTAFINSPFSKGTRGIYSVVINFDPDLATGDRIVRFNMDAQLTPTEINSYRAILQGDESAKEALASLEKHNGQFYSSLDELLVEKIGTSQTNDLARFRAATLEQLRKQACVDHNFRSKLEDYHQNLENSSVLKELIVDLEHLVGTEGFPIDPAIATAVVLYIVKIGSHAFCEGTALPATNPSSRRSDPSARRIPQD